MARTEAGATLTEAHRQGQLRVRAAALQSFLLLWPLWEGDEGSFQRLLTASLPLIRAYRGMSSALATSYFTAFRSAEGVAGTATPRSAPSLSDAEIKGTLHVLGQDSLREALSAGQSPTLARQTTLTKTSGAVTKFVQDGGRDAIVLSTAEDKQSLGWARVTDGDPCHFCRTLASRGAVYSADTADFQAHSHCGCVARPSYDGDPFSQAREYKAEYEAALREAKAEGYDTRGSKNALNAYRRYLDRQ